MSMANYNFAILPQFWGWGLRSKLGLDVRASKLASLAKNL